MNKHAYCIIAHKDLYTLNKLIQSVDDYRNDIFILIDKKSNLDINDFVKPIYSDLIISSQNNIAIYWGDISQIRAELEILKQASSHGHYSYYHLLSGQDLPIHSQDYIHNFFNQIPIHTNFIGFAHGLSNENSLKERISYYTLFTRFYFNSNKIIRYACDRIRNYYLKYQRKKGWHKKMPKIEYKKGCNWASLTDEFVCALLCHEKMFLKIYRGTPCCDEIYKQTFAWNSSFRDTIYNINSEYDGCIREIDWIRGGPYTFKFEDLPFLKSSTKLFARKFDSSIDVDIINAISDLNMRFKNYE